LISCKAKPAQKTSQVSINEIIREKSRFFLFGNRKGKKKRRREHCILMERKRRETTV
jgi:hypothetical protein